MDQSQSSNQPTVGQPTGTMKRTLNLTSLLVNAMALIAPGAFLWTTFQIQAAQTNGGITTAGEMWTGLVAALILAFLTAISYAELANIYPKAGSGSSYYYAEAAFLEKEKAGHRKWARVAKFLVGWISHLYYWIYPGIMVAFSAILIVYIFGLFGITLAVWQQILVAILFAVLNGYIAYRGISGSTMTAIIINAIQLAALIAFAILAILYRHAHPDLAYVQTASSILIPHNFTNLLFQSTIAILLLVGFESVTSLGSEALRPKQDIKRAILLSLIIQGIFAYLFEYFAAIYFVGPQLTGTDTTGAAVSGWGAAAASGAPIGDIVRVIGDQMLGGTGFILVIIFAATVVLALIGTTLACLNTGVRITYAMGKEKEVPTLLGVLHGKYDTPHYGIWILVAVSAALGAYGVLNVDNLTQITLASNTGTFLLYGLTNLIALWAFFHRPDSSILKHKLVPLLGFLANFIMFGAVIWLGISAGGNTANDAIIALAMVAVWLVAGSAWFIHNSKKEGLPVLTTNMPQANGLDKE
ncbi:APC family permease [Methanoregula sp.]|jgi:amino acid transporter|uniref:APC family permease n=1 Tax=Methanoregula sp. TaxID=2052170 RepID=UPI003D10BA8B